jgi:hypothetical protein
LAIHKTCIKTKEKNKMEYQNIQEAPANGDRQVQLNLAERNRIGVRVGDRVVVTKVIKTVVGATVHQAKVANIDNVVLTGGFGNEAVTTYEIAPAPAGEVGDVEDEDEDNADDEDANDEIVDDAEEEEDIF